MTNLTIIRDLFEFFELCMRSGFPFVTKSGDIIQLVIRGNNVFGKEDYRHFFKFVPMNIRGICCVSPMLSKKNYNFLKKVIEDYQNRYYVSVRPKFSWLWRCFGSGCAFKFDIFDAQGKKVKSKSIRLFTINWPLILPKKKKKQPEEFK